ncbi:TrkH family potassium uptake protein [Cohaesibacter sp. CAU 1516]|uniref:TrkH family potassium uptake protein n=1 Tax=Cohaesibacter sp. CAU 1516 TaxID=2576038 RepID=UPI0010FDFEB8|nr:potassium transporter TrkG [Cohaesibacter sp. CAU 1516]TLP49176.1 TrkH family potassium uptake protein [Cohaesibacter sp. CAU 1516]
MIAILYFLSILLGALGGLMLPTALVALSAGDSELAGSFLLTSGLTGFFSGGVYFALRGHKKELVNAQTFLLCVLAWFGLPLAGAFPFVISGQLNGIDSLFEAASGLTTTGSTMFRSLADVPTAMIFWRAILQWFGGLLTLLSFLLILAPSGIGGLPNQQVGVIERNLGDDAGRLLYVVRQIAAAYSVLTLTLAWLLIIADIPPFDAICLAFSTLSTGGFMPIDGTLAEYDNRLAELIIAMGMIIGSTSVLWHRMAVRGKFPLLREHMESIAMLVLVLSLGLLYSIVLFRLAGSASVLPPSSALRQGFFAAISLISTSGFELRHADVTVLPSLLVICVALVGATPFSTAGGLKLYRIGAMTLQAMSEISRLIHPSSVQGGRIGRSAFTVRLLKAIWSSFLLSMILIAVVAGMVTYDIGHFDGGLVAAISSFSNIGPLYTTGWSQVGAWPAYYDMDLIVKYALIVTMVLGRIEIIVLLGALNLNFWRR